MQQAKENIFGPDPEDRTRDPPHKNPTLYRVAIKAGLYRKAVQVCYIPIPCDILPLHIQIRPRIFTGVRESLEMRLKEVSCTCGLFTLGAKCNREEKYLRSIPGRGSNLRPSAQKSNTLPRRYKSRLVPQGSTSV